MSRADFDWGEIAMIKPIEFDGFRFSPGLNPVEFGGMGTTPTSQPTP